MTAKRAAKYLQRAIDERNKASPDKIQSLVTSDIKKALKDFRLFKKARKTTNSPRYSGASPPCSMPSPRGMLTQPPTLQHQARQPNLGGGRARMREDPPSQSDDNVPMDIVLNSLPYHTTYVPSEIQSFSGAFVRDNMGALT